MPKERILSLGFTRISAKLATQNSYRETAAILNLFYHRTGSEIVHLRTLSDSINRVGSEVCAAVKEQTDHTLRMYGFNTDTGLPEDDIELTPNITGANVEVSPDKSDLEKKQQAINAVNESRTVKIPFSAQDIFIENDPAKCVYISVDDIGVKRQKDQRTEDYVKDTANVENTVADIQFDDHRYRLTAVGMLNLFKSVEAFLLENSLLNRELIFFTDGAMNIKSNIGQLFAFHPYHLFLDWYHLRKKCQELLSSSIRGKDQRNACAQQLLRYLWVGDVDGAQDYLKSIPQEKIKSQSWLNEVSAYLDCKKDCITCYALRAQLGLRNSSNPVEKDNDLLVAQRQKHNGMAWTISGSGNLAALEMLFRNNQSEDWFAHKRFTLHIGSVDGSTAA